MKHYYIRTESAKFYVTDVNSKMTICDELCLYKNEKEELALCIPSREVKYYFPCSERAFELLPTDLKRGCIHL